MVDDPEKLEYNNCCDILCRNNSIPFSQVNWSDVTKALAGLKVWTKDKTYRSQITSEVVHHSKDIFEKSFPLEFGQGCNIRADVFRFLRNCCAGSSRNQECIINLGLLPMVVETVESALMPDEQLTSDDSRDAVKQLVESGIQLLGNLVTGHEENQQIVWGKCYHRFFQSVMNSRYEEAKNYTCMVMYNCMRQKPRPELVTTSEGISLINNIVQMCCKNKKDVEWGIFILELLFKFGFFSQLCDGLHDSYQRVFMLELIEDKLKDNQEPEYCVTWISVSNACYLSLMFEESISKIMNSEFDFAVEETSDQVILVGCLLRLLCLLTSFPAEYIELRDGVSLLQNTLVALRETSTSENQKLFSNVSQFPTTTDDLADSLHPTHGFKKNLVRLIANMCYHNRRNQDCVREMDAIPLLLDHCNIDDYNPYICQWAIFCLRNVLENNNENQEVIKSLKKLGLAKNERLLDVGFAVEEPVENRVRICSRKTENSTTKK